MTLFSIVWILSGILSCSIVVYEFRKQDQYVSDILAYLGLVVLGPVAFLLLGIIWLAVKASDTVVIKGKK
jgi:hypothetical protein